MAHDFWNSTYIGASPIPIKTRSDLPTLIKYIPLTPQMNVAYCSGRVA